jgi:probable HAF family extracellular repeat protein
MKFKTLKCITAMIVFAALASCVRLAAQGEATNFHHYKLIDMGTFGGPASFVNPPFNVRPILSSDGILVGGSATSIPTTSTSDPFVCGGIDGLVPNVFQAFEWRDGKTTDIGSLAGSESCSNAAVVNATGDIAGVSETSDLDPLLGVHAIHAVRWKDGVIADLGTLGGRHSSASGINSRGQIVGFALNTIPDPLSIIEFQIGGSTQGTQTRAFLWRNGQMEDLNTLGGPDAVAEFINERGQVAGFSYTNSTVNATTGQPTTHPFLWQNGKMVDLGTLGGTFAGSVLANFLGGLNNRGQVIGLSTLAGDQGCAGSLNGCVADPFLWSEGKMIDLFVTTTGGNPITADAINDKGEIVGAAAFSPSVPFDAYLWRDGVATDLGHLDGDCFSEGWAINARGEVVVISMSCDFTSFRAALWSQGSLVDLNALIPSDSSLELAWPLAINNRGEIAGLGVPQGCSSTNDNVCGHAFLLVPTDNDRSENNAPLALSSNSIKRGTDSLATIQNIARLRARMARRYLGFGSRTNK